MFRGFGDVIKGVGGLFTVRLLAPGSVRLPEDYEPQPLDGQTVCGRGRGTLHRKGALLVGDLVEVTYDTASFTVQDGKTVPASDGTGIAVERILPRRCELIRPPMANMDTLFVTTAAASPDPVCETLDKLICIAEYNRIEPVIVITKSDLNADSAQRLADIYRTSGFRVFSVNGITGEGVQPLRTFLQTELKGKITAFAGASGVGKSTLLNRLFPALSLETGEISPRIERGKNTTRSVELFPLSDSPDDGYVADTPGFTMLDFEHFDFFGVQDLTATFREFAPYIGSCRYTKCTHTKETDCAVLDAVRKGQIPPSRHESYCSLYNVLKKKPRW